MWSEYKGRRYLDIRVYTEIEGKADKVPTEKGVTLWPDLTPELIKALKARSRDHADTRVLAVVSFSNSAPPKDRLAVSAPIGETMGPRGDLLLGDAGQGFGVD